MNQRPMGPGDYVIAALFGAVILVVGAGVLWRYVLDSPLVWTVELSRILFTWMIFVGAALAIKEGTHIRVSLLVDRLPANAARYFSVGFLVLIVAFLGIMVYFGFEYVRLESGSRTPALGLPQAYVWYAALPVSFSFGVYFAVRKAIRDWRNPSRHEPASRDE
ncbi:MAG: TRAP transporter small permease [Planctomycetota bacterium]